MNSEKNIDDETLTEELCESLQGTGDDTFPPSGETFGAGGE